MKEDGFTEEEKDGMGRKIVEGRRVEFLIDLI
jgi:hypothetical protein